MFRGRKSIQEKIVDKPKFRLFYFVCKSKSTSKLHCVYTKQSNSETNTDKVEHKHNEFGSNSLEILRWNRSCLVQSNGIVSPSGFTFLLLFSYSWNFYPLCNPYIFFKEASRFLMKMQLSMVYAICFCLSSKCQSPL